MKEKKRIAVLTGGGDCPGLNAAIRAVVHRASQRGDEVIGIREGWRGFLEEITMPINLQNTEDILPLGGTILGASRVNPFKVKDGIKQCLDFFRRKKLHVLVSIGGEGTLQITAACAKEGMPVVCIPKTIDNDTWGTDFTIGFQTAVQVATDAIDRLHTTAASHHEVMIVEVMGRHAGWIAAYSGIAGGADAILLPEEVTDIQDLCATIEERKARGRHYSIVVVSEDARIRLENKEILRTPVNHDEYGDVKLGGIGEQLGEVLRKRTHYLIRVTILGHIQRGGTPTAYDRILATRLGLFAMDLVYKGDFGKMAVLKGNDIDAIPITESTGHMKTVDKKTIEFIRSFLS